LFIEERGKYNVDVIVNIEIVVLFEVMKTKMGKVNKEKCSKVASE